METSKGIIKGAISLSVTAILVKIIGVMYKVPISYILGDEGMGYFNSAYTIYSFFYIICASGIPRAVTVVLTEIKVKEKKLNTNKITGKIIVLFSLIGFIISLVCFCLTPFLSIITGTKKTTEPLLAIIPSLFFICVSGVVRGYLNAEMKLGSIALSQAAEAFFKLVFGLGFAIAGKRLGITLERICALSILGITLGSIASFIILYISYKINKKEDINGQNIKYSSKNVYKQIFKIAFPITLGSAILSFGSIIDMTLIMRGLLTLGYSEQHASSEYGNYTTLVVPMVNLVIAVISPITIALLPKLKQYDLTNEKSKFIESFDVALKIIVIICSFSLFAFSAYPYEILDILFSSESSKSASISLFIISPSVLILSVLTVINTALEAKGKNNVVLLSNIICVLIKLVSSIILIFNKRFALLGAPIGTVLSYSVALIFSIYFLNRNVKIIRVLFDSVKYIFYAFLSVYIPYVFKLLIYGEERITFMCIPFCIFSGFIYFLFIFATDYLHKRTVLFSKHYQKG